MYVPALENVNVATPPGPRCRAQRARTHAYTGRKRRLRRTQFGAQRSDRHRQRFADVHGAARRRDREEVVRCRLGRAQRPDFIALGDEHEVHAIGGQLFFARAVLCELAVDPDSPVDARVFTETREVHPIDADDFDSRGRQKGLPAAARGVVERAARARTATRAAFDRYRRRGGRHFLLRNERFAAHALHADGNGCWNTGERRRRRQTEDHKRDRRQQSHAKTRYEHEPPLSTRACWA